MVLSVTNSEFTRKTRVSVVTNSEKIVLPLPHNCTPSPVPPTFTFPSLLATLYRYLFVEGDVAH